MLALVMMFGLAACGGGDKAAPAPDDGKDGNKGGQSSEPQGITTVIDKKVEVEFWHAMSGGHEEALNKIVNDFNAQSEFITIKPVNQGSYGDLSQKLMASAKAKKMPVMAQTYEDWVTEYIQNNLVTDLTPYINDPKYGWSEDELNDIVQVFREANQWDGKYYSLPFNKSTRILFYNKGLFEEKGVKVPTTWEELTEAAAKLTIDKDGDGKNDVIGMGFENSVGQEFSAYVLQAGGEYLDEKEKKVKFNSPEGVAALKFINDMIQNGTARLAGEDGYMSNPFGRGDVAMYVGSSAGIPFVAKAAEGNIEWSATVLPKGKKAATPFAGTNVSVFASATDEQKLAAWEFIKFLINTENTAYWAEKSGYLPVRYSALELASYKAYKEANPVQGVGELQFEAGFYEPRVVGAYGMRKAVSKEIEAVLLGQKSVEQGLADAEKAANAEINK